MKALVIYDGVSGEVLVIRYGTEEVPQGVPWLWAEIPDGAKLDKYLDMTDSENPKPVFIYGPDDDIGKALKRTAELEEQLTDTQLALTEQYEENLALQEEVTNTQLALTEVYETMLVAAAGEEETEGGEE